ncbi:MAG TPA: ribbon-helix-helix domain-containing protein [Terriglobia bacterium]
MKTISLKLDDEIDAKLTAAAKRTRKSKSQVTREALAAFLERRGPKAGISCLDLVKDLVGAAKGPGDLASNKKHMRGYGR